MIENGSEDYLSKWYNDSCPAGNTEAKRDACWQLAKDKVPQAEGIMWVHNNTVSGIVKGGCNCSAIVNSTYLLPWKQTYPDKQSSTKLCLLKSKIPGK